MKYFLFLLFIMISSVSCRIFHGHATRSEKETIVNPEAAKLYDQATDGKTNDGGLSSVDLLNKADSIEPNNPFILHERGLLKFNKGNNDESAFLDMDRSIELSLDSSWKRTRLHNRGLCYMGIGDMNSACRDWHLAGKSGAYYITKYCNLPFETTILENPDEKIQIKLELLDTITSITSTHNPPVMTNCFAKVSITNVDAYPVIISDYLNYAIESDSSSLYLEALSHGKKFRFSQNLNLWSPTNSKDFNLTKGKTFTAEVNIVSQHQFSYPGIYKVRIVLRPSESTKGLTKKYYSNWETLTVMKGE